MCSCWNQRNAEPMLSTLVAWAKAGNIASGLLSTTLSEAVQPAASKAYIGHVCEWLIQAACRTPCPLPQAVRHAALRSMIQRLGSRQGICSRLSAMAGSTPVRQQLFVLYGARAQRLQCAAPAKARAAFHASAPAKNGK